MLTAVVSIKEKFALLKTKSELKLNTCSHKKKKLNKKIRAKQKPCKQTRALCVGSFINFTGFKCKWITRLDIMLCQRKSLA